MSQPDASRFSGTRLSGGLMSAAVNGIASCEYVVGTHGKAVADEAPIPSTASAGRAASSSLRKTFMSPSEVVVLSRPRRLVSPWLRIANERKALSAPFSSPGGYDVR